MVRVNGDSRNFQRRRDFESNAFQIRTHLVERQPVDVNNIFTKYPSGLEFRNNAKHFRPEETVVACALSFPGATEWLTRKSAANKFCCSEFITSHLSYIVNPLHVRPVMRKNGPAVRINLHLSDALHACPFEPKIETPNSCKQTHESEWRRRTRRLVVLGAQTINWTKRQWHITFPQTAAAVHRGTPLRVARCKPRILLLRWFCIVLSQQSLH